MAARIIVRIEITSEARTRFAGLADRTGMTQIAVTSRLFEWFASQHEGVQAAVLGQYPAAIEADVAKLLLARGIGSTSTGPRRAPAPANPRANGGRK